MSALDEWADKWAARILFAVYVALFCFVYWWVTK